MRRSTLLTGCWLADAYVGRPTKAGPHGVLKSQDTGRYACTHGLVHLARHKIVEAQGSQGTQTRGTWDVCITEGGSSIKNQTIYIGSMKGITGAFFLEGVLYIKLISHVPISVSTRMTLA